ncbi:MAG: hypothetical protein ACFE9D_01300 [Promethearchaeota archaeon]
MSYYSGIVEGPETSQKLLVCLATHIQAQMFQGSFMTLIHAGNSDYIRLLHILISKLLLNKHRVYVFDYHRRIKPVYLQQLLYEIPEKMRTVLQKLTIRVILDENHALDELMQLQRLTPSRRRPPALFFIDPSSLFSRLRGGVKQSSEGLQFQYEAAMAFAQKGYSVVVSDFGGRHFHRIESVVPAQLAEPSTLILQFLPRQILLFSS